MNKKYAMIWNTNLKYWKGTNGILNALEYYDFKDTDVYVLTLEEFPLRYQHSFCDDVHFVQIDKSWWSEPKSDYWWLVFADFIYAIDYLFDKYPVILFWGADVCPLNNFERYFDVANNLGMPILGTNDQMGGDLDHLKNFSQAWPYKHTNDTPFADIPMFIPEGHSDLVQLTLDYQKEPGCEVDRMDAMNYAIRDLQLVKDIFPVPGAYWIFNAPDRAALERRNSGIYLLGTRMEAFHRKYWMADFCRKYFGDIKSQVKENNIRLFNRMWNFFNYDCRVKMIDEPIEIY